MKELTEVRLQNAYSLKKGYYWIAELRISGRIEQEREYKTLSEAFAVGSTWVYQCGKSRL